MTKGTARSTMTLEDGLYLFALQRKLAAKQGMRMNRGNPPDRSAASAWRLGWLPLAAGLFIALLQTAAIDWIRYQLTGTWNGFTL